MAKKADGRGIRKLIRESLLQPSPRQIAPPPPALVRPQQDGATAQEGVAARAQAKPANADRDDMDSLRELVRARTEELGGLIQPQPAPKASYRTERNSREGSVLRTVLGASLGGVVPLISGITSLFGGGEPKVVDPPRYTLPKPVNVEAGLTTSGQSLVPAVYDTKGLLKTQPTGQGVTQQVTVHVQAMDSRSFLDNRDQIAQAVRSAMLHSSSLNDVINEL